MLIGLLSIEEFPSECQTQVLEAATDIFESAGVDLCLPENVSLAVCKFSIHALEAFRFRGIAVNEDDEYFQDHN